MVSRRKVLQLASGVSATALAGCFGGGDSPGDGGGDGDGTETGAGREITTRPYGVIGTSTAAREYSEYEWNELEDGEPVDTNRVTLTEQATFEPQIARVPPGATVTWEIESDQPESITIPKLGVDKTTMGGEAEIEVTFEEEGVYNYLCKHHSPDHIGRIVVDSTLTAMDDGGDGGDGTTEES